MSSILRGPLQGPRLSLALFCAVLLFFYLRSHTPSQQQGGVLVHPDEQPAVAKVADDGAPSTNPGGEDYVSKAKNEKESESLSNQFLEYLQGHSSHGHESHSPVPHEEHAGGAAPPVSAPATSENATTSTDPFCASLPDTSDLLVVVRTQAAELYTQLPAHFFTTLRCADFLLYSTVHQNIGPYTVYDALANISDARRAKHRDFELYDKLQDAQNAATDLYGIGEDNEHNLDKWAIIPHVVAAYNQHPEKKWFVFIESDTYLSLSNILPWLSKMDPEQDLYAGAQVMIGDIELAHSGSGIVLSQATAKKLARKFKERSDAWQDMVGNSCCGDKILAEALKEVNVTLHRSFPMIQGETPFSLDWSERHWCRTAMTWHRMVPSTIDMLWQLEHAWVSKHAESGSIPPMLFKDYFQTFLVPLIRHTHNRTNWDNLANSLTYTDQSGGQFAHYSFDACRAACDLRHTCVQYAWEPNKCRLGTVVRLGEKVKSDKRMMSGWLTKRVEKFGDKIEVCEAENAYLMPTAKEEQDEMKMMEEERTRREEEMLAAEEERVKKEQDEKAKKDEEEAKEKKKKKEMDEAKKAAEGEAARIKQEIEEKKLKAAKAKEAGEPES